MAVCNKETTQFYLPPTHKPYLPLLPSRKASPPCNNSVRCVEEMRAAANFCSCPTPCETSNYVPTASFSIVMGPETSPVMDESTTALRLRLFRARETSYRIDGDKWSATLRRFHVASRAVARGARHAEASETTMNDGYDTVDGHATQVVADCVRMRNTLSTARSNIYDYIITPLETYRIRFLPVTMDAFLAIQVSEPLNIIITNLGLSQ